MRSQSSLAREREGWFEGGREGGREAPTKAMSWVFAGSRTSMSLCTRKHPVSEVSSNCEGDEASALSLVKGKLLGVAHMFMQWCRALELSLTDTCWDVATGLELKVTIGRLGTMERTQMGVAASKQSKKREQSFRQTVRELGTRPKCELSGHSQKNALQQH